MFQAAKRFGAGCLVNDSFAQRCKAHVCRGFLGMGVRLAEDHLKFEFYKPENVIVALVPDGVFHSFGKIGKSVSLRKINIICVEQSLFLTDCAKWIEHEVGHVISWRDYRDKPMVSSPFITGGEENPFNPADVLGHGLYPNIWSEYIPFTRQMAALLNCYSAEVVLQMIMQDYYEGQSDFEKLKSYEKIFIRYLNCALAKAVVSPAVDAQRRSLPLSANSCATNSCANK